MGRTSNQMVTYVDLDYMVKYEGFNIENSFNIYSKQATTKEVCVNIFGDYLIKSVA